MCPDSERSAAGVLLTAQPLRNSNSTTAQTNHHSKKKLTIPKPREQKEKESGRGREEVRTNTDPSTVAKSHTKLTNKFRRISKMLKCPLVQALRLCTEPYGPQGE